jgi:hypothetical protein
MWWSGFNIAFGAQCNFPVGVCCHSQIIGGLVVRRVACYEVFCLRPEEKEEDAI